MRRRGLNLKIVHLSFNIKKFSDYFTHTQVAQANEQCYLSPGNRCKSTHSIILMEGDAVKMKTSCVKHIVLEYKSIAAIWCFAGLSRINSAGTSSI